MFLWSTVAPCGRGCTVFSSCRISFVDQQLDKIRFHRTETVEKNVQCVPSETASV